jgi:pimeloyl-ACP methyl ester carboxylesterase
VADVISVTPRECRAGHRVSEPVSIVTPDGITLAATFYPSGAGEPSGAVLLLHMADRTKKTWDGFATFVQECSQYALLAVDLRGHGGSGGSQDWSKLPQDVQAAWEALIQRDEIDPDRTAVVGASIGANLALVQAANEPRIRGIALLSPGLAYQGIKTADAMHLYGRRPVLVVAAQQDSYAADSSRKLSDLAEGEHELEMLPGNAHGTDLLEAEPDLRWLILDWLGKVLGGPG